MEGNPGYQGKCQGDEDEWTSIPGFIAEVAIDECENQEGPAGHRRQGVGGKSWGISIILPEHRSLCDDSLSKLKDLIIVGPYVDIAAVGEIYAIAIKTCGHTLQFPIVPNTSLIDNLLDVSALAASSLITLLERICSSLSEKYLMGRKSVRGRLGDPGSKAIMRKATKQAIEPSTSISHCQPWYFGYLVPRGRIP